MKETRVNTERWAEKLVTDFSEFLKVLWFQYLLISLGKWKSAEKGSADPPTCDHDPSFSVPEASSLPWREVSTPLAHPRTGTSKSAFLSANQLTPS